jgi:benzoate membrane transport protein
MMTPRPTFVAPDFSVEAIVGLAALLFIVTMASQNLPGLAVLGAHGYHPSPGPLVAATGVFALMAAPFGGHAVNLSAITAALCASPDAAPDRPSVGSRPRPHAQPMPSSDFWREP